MNGIDYAKSVLSLSYDLSVYYEFYNIPKINEIILFLTSFKYCYFWFTLEKNHTAAKNLNDLNEMNSLFTYLQDKNCCIGLVVSTSQIRKNKDYFRMFWNLWSKYKMYIIEYQWDIEVPSPFKEQKYEFEKFLNLSKKKNNIFIYIKNRIIEAAYGQKSLFSLLLIIETYLVLFKCIFIFLGGILTEKVITIFGKKFNFSK